MYFFSLKKNVSTYFSNFFLITVERKLVWKSRNFYKTCLFFLLENCFYSYLYISTLQSNYTHIKMTHLSQPPPDMSSIGEVCDSLGTDQQSCFGGNRWATGRLRVNSTSVKVRLRSFPLSLPKGNAMLPMTPKAGCSRWKVCYQRGLPRLVCKDIRRQNDNTITWPGVCYLCG